VHEFDRGHLRAVALAGLERGDAQVAAGTVAHARADVIEHLCHDLGIVDEPEGLAAGVEVPAAAESDDLLGHGANLLRLGLGGGDALVPEEVGDQVPVEGTAVCSVTAEMAAGYAVSHG